MSRYKFHDLDSAPADSKPVLEKVKSAYGFVPNLLGGLAESPVAAEAYPTLNGIFEKSSFSDAEKHVVIMTASFENNCEYCMAAHTASAESAEIPQQVIEGLRNGDSLGDDKLDALRNFTRAVVEKRGALDESDLKAFFDAGFTPAQSLEVLVGVSLKTLSNYANHILETPLDDAFQEKKWSKPVGAGA